MSQVKYDNTFYLDALLLFLSLRGAKSRACSAAERVLFRLHGILKAQSAAACTTKVRTKTRLSGKLLADAARRGSASRCAAYKLAAVCRRALSERVMYTAGRDGCPATDQCILAA